MIVSHGFAAYDARDAVDFLVAIHGRIPRGGMFVARRFLIGVLMLIAMTTAFTSPAIAQQLKPDEKRALEAKPAVVLVVVEFKAKWTLGDTAVTLTHREIGTGFFFHPDGYLITNGHVVQYANMKDLQAEKSRQEELKADNVNKLKEVVAAYEKQTGKSVTEAQIGALWHNASIAQVGTPTITVVLENRKTVNADILQYSAPIDENGKDVAILKVPGGNYPTVPLGNSDQVRLQDAIMVMGYPGVASQWGDNPLISADSNYEASATNGHISAVKTGPMGMPVLQTDTAITHGNSGGPAFNDAGEVIGIATFGNDSVQGFNFLVAINTAKEFVRQTGVSATRSTFDEHWDRALDLYDASQFKSAIAEFDNVLQFMPDLPDARKFRAAAVDGEDHLNFVQKTVETVGTTGIYAIVGALLLGAILVVALRGKSSGKKPAPMQQQPQQHRSSTMLKTVVVASGGGTLPTIGRVSYGTIEFTSGGQLGRTFRIGRDGLKVGRDPRCEVVLPDETVSGEHAWIVPMDGGVFVIDKGSSNGTYVNSADSERVSKAELKDGDRIFIGRKGPVAVYSMN
jgi:S1-C subfamily serine protease